MPIALKAQYAAVALGSNIAPRAHYLSMARALIHQITPLMVKSSLYQSPAIEYLQQDDFYNQVIICFIPPHSPFYDNPKLYLKKLQEIEIFLQRKREVLKGPRTIDLDLIFFAHHTEESSDLLLPHPSWSKRSFVTVPLQEIQAQHYFPHRIIRELFHDRIIDPPLTVIAGKEDDFQ